MLFYTIKYSNSYSWNALFYYIGINFYYLFSNYFFRFINISYISMKSFLSMLKQSKNSFVYNNSYSNDLLISDYTSISFLDSDDLFYLFYTVGKKKYNHSLDTIKISCTVFFVELDTFLVCLMDTSNLLDNIFVHNYLYTDLIYFKYVSSLTCQFYTINDRHSLLKNTVYKFIDDFKCFGLEDYSLKVDYFSDLSIRNFFCIRYGLGFFVSRLICKYLGISNQMLLSNLVNYWEYSSGNKFFDDKSKYLDEYLSSYILSRHKFLISLNNRKGIRLLNGYPINGQRTRSNAKTASRFPYKLKFKSI